MNEERLLEAVAFLAEKARPAKESGKEYHKELSFWSARLGKLGFSDREVGTALSWILERFGADGEKRPAPASVRIFSEAEMSLFTADAFSALVRYYALGILPTDRLELLLGKVGWAGKAPVDRKNLEWLVSILIFSPAERMMGYPADPASPTPHAGGVH
ncbi:MAG: DUF494 domain-containing protein [candidate division Zixibacteria bacterium]|nr:DUF494 domain-containing protein [candidate division Zixibacteria bacterium]